MYSDTCGQLLRMYKSAFATLVHHLGALATPWEQYEFVRPVNLKYYFIRLTSMRRKALLVTPIGSAPPKTYIQVVQSPESTVKYQKRLRTIYTPTPKWGGLVGLGNALQPATFRDLWILIEVLIDPYRSL